MGPLRTLQICEMDVTRQGVLKGQKSFQAGWQCPLGSCQGSGHVCIRRKDKLEQVLLWRFIPEKELRGHRRNGLSPTSHIPRLERLTGSTSRPQNLILRDYTAAKLWLVGPPHRK